MWRALCRFAGGALLLQPAMRRQSDNLKRSYCCGTCAAIGHNAGQTAVSARARVSGRTRRTNRLGMAAPATPWTCVQLDPRLRSGKSRRMAHQNRTSVTAGAAELASACPAPAGMVGPACGGKSARSNWERNLQRLSLSPKVWWWIEKRRARVSYHSLLCCKNSGSSMLLQ